MGFDKKKWINIDYDFYFKEMANKNYKSNSIITLIKQRQLESFYKSYPKTSNKLDGIPFGVKDNFTISGIQTTGGTGILEGYEPNFSSSIVKRLVQAGAIPVMKTNVDELAMGGTGLTSKYGEVRNPYDNSRMIGGSSSGSSYVLAAGIVPFALGSDTGDSIRLPAAFGGIIGFKPTWGMISRHGIYDFAPTWDTVGFFTESVKQQAILLDVTAGLSPNDSSVVASPQRDFEKKLVTENFFKLGYFQEIIDVSAPYIKKIFMDTKLELEKKGHTVIAVKPRKEILETILPVYRIITHLEAFSQNANLTGFLFGSNFDIESAKSFEEKITEARTKGFGYEVKKRFLFGQHAILNGKDLYEKAQRARQAISEELKRLLGEVDALYNPAQPHPAHVIGSPYETTVLAENYLTLFNASGMPGITIGIKKDKELPMGLSIHTDIHKDLECLQIGKIIEGINND